MNAMSTRREAGGTGDGRRPRTFLCRDELYDAFERRARELECSVDWLLGEAMKRLLRPPLVSPPPPPVPPAAAPLPPLPPLPPPPPPPPPRPRRPTGSFVGPKPAVSDAIALRLREQRVVVDRDRFVLGRSARDAHFPLRDQGVSRQHAILERATGPGGGWIVIDMASTNGIRLNGARVTRAPIRAGDRLEIGPFEITVERA